jgi:DnaJ-class molecular chaperone
MPKDYYLVLGIGRGADLNKIKKAHRRVVKKHHPNVSALQEGGEKFREIREAYETLGDQVKRRRYDEELTRQGSEVRITRDPDIIENRRSLLDEIDMYFSRTVTGATFIRSTCILAHSLTITTRRQALLNRTQARSNSLRPLR